VTVTGVLLAAGEGRRLGVPKALVSFEGELLVQRGVRLLHEGGCDAVRVVLGARAPEVLERGALAAEVVVNSSWAEGMATSLHAALAGHGPQVTAVLIALVDQPRVGPEAVRRLLTAHRSGSVAAVATYGGEPRNPVLLDRSLWPDVVGSSTGDRGAREWLRAHHDIVVEVPCDDTGSPDDIDTPADLAALVQQGVPDAAGA
jgi:CTP:molybdopterin cytidylyltransferase MocA